MAPDGVKTRKRVKRKPTPVWRRRRVVIGIAVGLLAVLLAVNLYYVLDRSPRRRSYFFFKEGLVAYQTEDWATAKIHFARCVEVAPDRDDAWYMLGLTHFRLREEAEGVRALVEATRIRPKHAYAQTTLAEHYRRKGALFEAQRRATLATTVEPVPADSWIALGKARRELGDAEGAIEAFRRAVAKDPDLIETQLDLAELYAVREILGLEDVTLGLARKRYEAAAEAAERMAGAHPEDALPLLWLAKAQAGQGLVMEALKTMGRVVSKEPEDPKHRVLKARFEEAGGDPEKAVETLTKAWEEVPDPEVARRLSDLLGRRIFDPAEARRVLEVAIERFPSDSGLRIAHIALLRNQGEVDAAGVALLQALRTIPGDSLLLEAAGDAALADGARDEAKERYRAAIKVRSENISARRKLAAMLLDEVLDVRRDGGSASEARSELEEQIAFFLDPSTGLNPGDLTARGWKGRLLFADGDFEGAALVLGEQGGRAPTSYEGLKLLGISRLQSGDFSGASDALFDALKHPRSAHTAEDYDLAYIATFRKGQVSRELAIASDACSRWPRDVDWRLKLANSLYRSGRHADAIAACDLAKTLLAGRRDARAHLLASRIHHAAGSLTRARSELEDAVLIQNDARTRGALYAFLAATGDARLAEAGFRTLIDENPDDPEAFLAFGRFFLKKSGEVGQSREHVADMRRQALQLFEKALLLDPGSTIALRSVAELRMAEASDQEAAIAAARDAVARIEAIDAEDPTLLYLEGKLHILEEEYDRAATALGQYVRANRNDAAGYYYLGVARRKTRDVAGAQECFQAAISLDPTMGEAKLELAALYFARGLNARWEGDAEGARLLFERVLEIDPREPETLRFLAEALANLGLEDEAVDRAEAVLREKPDDTGALFLSGLFLAKKGELAAAQGRFRRLVELAPDNPRSHLYLGMALADAGDRDGARASLLKAFQLDRASDEVLRALVANESVAGRSGEMIGLLENLVRAGGTPRPFAGLLLASLYGDAGRNRDALAAYRRAFEEDPDDLRGLLLAAAILADEGRYQEAVDLLTEGAERSGRPAAALHLRGRMHEAMGDQAAAERSYRDALASDAGLRAAYRDLGLLLARRGDAPEARTLLNEALARGVEDSGMLFRLALACEGIGEREEAIGHYRRILVAVPGDVPTLNNLAVQLAKTKEGLAEAVDFAGRARAAAPEDPAVADTFGWILCLADRPEEAVPHLTAAAKKLPGHAEVLHHAGIACYRTYRTEEARDYLRRALLADPEYEGAAEARDVLEKTR